MKIWLEGAPCSESAERTKESTMTMRVKQVISRMIDGASVSSVMTASTLIAPSTSTGWFKPLRPMFKLRLLLLVCAVSPRGRRPATSRSAPAPTDRPARVWRRSGVHDLRANTCWKASAKLNFGAASDGSPSAAGKWLSSVTPVLEEAMSMRCCS